jgi:hypothetical protein
MNNQLSEQLKQLQTRLENNGVKSISFFRDTTVNVSKDELVQEVLEIFQAYEQGNYKSFKFNDSVRLKNGDVCQLN